MKLTENEKLELKKSTSELKEGIISVVSMLNKHNSGELLFGITPDGSVVGQNVTEKTIRDARKSGRIKFEYTNKKNVLQKLELIKNEKLYNAGNILFCNNTVLEVQTAVFAGTEKITFLDINDKKGNLFGMLSYSENYIKEHINWRADLTTGTRKEIPEIPIRAVSEALVNSFCHRDYTAPESNKIAIYKDRIEIWNPGEFPSEYKPLDFVRNELPSILRNPKIAQILYYNEKIERWGSGLKRIYEECRLNDVKVEFIVLKYGFSVIFYRDNSKDISIANRTQIGRKSDTKLSSPSYRQEWIIDYLKKNKEIRSIDIINKFNIVKDTVARDLKKLIDKNIIKKYGGGNNVWYELNSD